MDKLIFFDAEWAPKYLEYKDLPLPLKDAWDHKSLKFHSKYPDYTVQQIYEAEAHWFPEFCVIVCVSVGIVLNGKRHIHTASGEEKDLLTKISKLFQKYGDLGYVTIGHATKRFDIPFICRRMVINRVELPDFFKFTNKKPWEIKHLDTSEIWSFGAYQEKYSPFEFITAALDVESPKTEMDGSMVKQYFHTGRTEEICKYCENDVRALIDVWETLKPYVI